MKKTDSGPLPIHNNSYFRNVCVKMFCSGLSVKKDDTWKGLPLDTHTLYFYSDYKSAFMDTVFFTLCFVCF